MPTTVHDDAQDTLDNVVGIQGVQTGGTGGNMSATGGTGHIVKQASVGAAFTTGTLSDTELPDGVAVSIYGRSVNSGGDRGDIQSTADGQYVVRRSSVVGWEYGAGLGVGIDVHAKATGGTGTSGNPWTGWDTAITWAANTTYYFRNGVYSYANSPNFALTGIRLIGEGATLKHTGSGKAVNFTGPAGHAYNVEMRDFIIQSNASTTNALYLQKVSHSRFARIRVTGASQEAVLIKGCVSTELDTILCSSNEGAFTAVPTDGIVFDSINGSAPYEPSSCITCINCTVEGVSNAGFYIKSCHDIRIYGCLSEFNGYGLIVQEYNGTFPTACYINMDFEANLSDQVLCKGPKMFFDSCHIEGIFRLTTVWANDNVVCGGSILTAIIEANTNRNCFRDLNISTSLTDNGNKTQFKRVFLEPSVAWQTDTYYNGQGLLVSDADFSIGDSANLTKRVQINAGNVTAGQTRILTAPDYNGTIATLAGSEALSNKTYQGSTLETTGNVGIGVAPSGTGGEMLTAELSSTGSVVSKISNPNAAGTTSVAKWRAQASTVIVDVSAHGAGSTSSRWGESALANWAELAPTNGSGLAVGTRTAVPLRLGTNAVTGIKIDGANQHPSFPVSHKRVTVQYDNSTTTFGAVAGLTVNVTAGLTYGFRAVLHTTSDVGGGVKCAISGTATATAIVYDATVYFGGQAVATTTQRGAALGAAVGQVTAVTTAKILIEGVITVNAAGTLLPQLACNVAVGTTSALVGSEWFVWEIA